MGQEISLSRKNRNRMLKKDFNDQSRQSTSIEFNDIDYFKDNVNFPLNVVKSKVSLYTGGIFWHYFLLFRWKWMGALKVKDLDPTILQK